MDISRWSLVMLLAAAPLADAAAATYRCQGADGKVTYADRPCEAGQQTVATLGGKGKASPATATASAAAAASAAAPTPVPAPTVVASKTAPAGQQR